jgi:hypothetical protein
MRRESDQFMMVTDDSREDTTDGMGAVIFTDEEDCGFFGMLCRIDAHCCILMLFRALPRTLPLPVIYP